jgi:hypothetical protein
LIPVNQTIGEQFIQTTGEGGRRRTDVLLEFSEPHAPLFLVKNVENVEQF